MYVCAPHTHHLHVCTCSSVWLHVVAHNGRHPNSECQLHLCIRVCDLVSALIICTCSCITRSYPVKNHGSDSIRSAECFFFFLNIQ